MSRDEPTETWSMVTPRGAPATFTIRTDCSDGPLAYGTMSGSMGHGSDEYDLAGRFLSGWAIDIGAHIGSVAIPLAIDNPDLRVLAVECLPPNVEMLRRNIEDNGLGGRVIAVEAAAGGPGEVSRTCWYGFGDHPDVDPGYLPAQRYIGNTWYEEAKAGRVTSLQVEMPVLSLDALLATHGIGDVAFLKIDAEGAEWAFLDTPAIARIETMMGEFHATYAGQAADAVRTAPTRGPTGPIEDGPSEIRRLLAATHEVTFDSDDKWTGLFRAVRR